MYSSVRSTIRDVEEATRWNDSGADVVLCLL